MHLAPKPTNQPTTETIDYEMIWRDLGTQSAKLEDESTHRALNLASRNIERSGGVRARILESFLKQKKSFEDLDPHRAKIEEYFKIILAAQGLKPGSQENQDSETQKKRRKSFEASVQKASQAKSRNENEKQQDKADKVARNTRAPGEEVPKEWSCANPGCRKAAQFYGHAFDCCPSFNNQQKNRKWLFLRPWAETPHICAFFCDFCNELFKKLISLDLFPYKTEEQKKIQENLPPGTSLAGSGDKISNVKQATKIYSTITTEQVKKERLLLADSELNNIMKYLYKTKGCHENWPAFVRGCLELRATSKQTIKLLFPNAGDLFLGSLDELKKHPYDMYLMKGDLDWSDRDFDSFWYTLMGGDSIKFIPPPQDVKEAGKMWKVYTSKALDMRAIIANNGEVVGYSVCPKEVIKLAHSLFMNYSSETHTVINSKHLGRIKIAVDGRQVGKKKETQIQVSFEFLDLDMVLQSENNVFILSVANLKENRAAYEIVFSKRMMEILQAGKIKIGTEEFTFDKRLVGDFKSVWDILKKGWNNDEPGFCPHCDAKRNEAHDFDNCRKIKPGTHRW